MTDLQDENRFENMDTPALPQGQPGLPEVSLSGHSSPMRPI